MMKHLYSFVILISITMISPGRVNAQWTPLGEALGGDILKLHVFNSNLYGGGTAYLFRSTNNGTNWTSHLNHLAYAWSIASSGSVIYCGVWSGVGQSSGVYKSTNNGLNWGLSGLTNRNISDIAADNQQVIAIDFVNNKVWRSTNNGNNWNDITGPLSLGVYKAAVSGNRIYAGLQGLHVTTNNGAGWNAIFMTDNIESVSVSDSLVFAGTYSSGIYRSSNYGQNWERTLNISKRILCVYQYGANVFAGVDSGFYVSTNSGLNFVEKSQGIQTASISSVAVNNGYIFVSNSNYLNTNVGGWKRPLTEVIGIENIGTEIPMKHILYQNYPNPFNPSTKIKFDVSPDSRLNGNYKVVLKIYDVLGKEISVLVNQQLQAGSFEAEWDAANCPGGVYFYKLTISDFAETKKMVLLK